MEMRELTIRKRDGIGKGPAKRLRRAGEVPATLCRAGPVNVARGPGTSSASSTATRAAPSCSA
jgi:ribosomal protein L25 (general stress protein Ctc)